MCHTDPADIRHVFALHADNTDIVWFTDLIFAARLSVSRWGNFVVILVRAVRGPDDTKTTV